MRAYVRVCVCMERAVRCAIVRSPVHTHECAMHKFAHARVCTFVRVYVCLCVCVCESLGCVGQVGRTGEARVMCAKLRVMLWGSS